MTDLLSPDEIAERIAAVEGAQAPSVVSNDYRYVQPFSNTADTLIDYIQNSDGRLMFGLKEVDMMTRGFGPGELCYVTGFAHSGKTQLFLTAICNNLDRRIVLFTFDEPAELVLAKLVALSRGKSYEWIEQQIKEKNEQVIRQVREVAANEMKNLIVIDSSLSLGQMSEALREAEDYWGASVDGVGIDFLELLRSEESEVEKKSQELKRWVMEENVPVLCLHQGSRGNAGKGQKLTMQSMKYGGEAEATFVIGVRRKKDDEGLDEWERNKHANTVSISVIKNKRPPSKKGERDFALDPETGLIRPLENEDFAPVPKEPEIPGQTNIYGDEEPF